MMSLWTRPWMSSWTGTSLSSRSKLFKMCVFICQTFWMVLTTCCNWKCCYLSFHLPLLPLFSILCVVSLLSKMHVYSYYTAWHLHCPPDFCLLLTVSLRIFFSPSQVRWCKPLLSQNHHHSIHPLCQPEMGTLQIVNLKYTLYTVNIIVGMHQSNIRIGYQPRSCQNSWIG